MFRLFCCLSLSVVLLVVNAAGQGSSSISSSGSSFIPANSSLVHWSGRTIPSGGGSSGIVGDYAGIAATISVSNNFSYVLAHISDGCAAGNKFTATLTGEGLSSFPVASFYTSPAVTSYVLFAATGRANFWGEVATLRLSKSVEARFTQCSGASNLTFVGFESDGVFLPPPVPQRKIEFIGDSISGGDLVHCLDFWGSHTTLNNSLWADNAESFYGSLLGTFFGADVSTVSWGGMGLVANDVPSWTWPTLPLVYPSALAWQVEVDGPGAPISHPWDPQLYVPDLVGINLGTNDAGGGRFNNASFAALFEDTYVAFIQNISRAYATGGAEKEHETEEEGEQGSTGNPRRTQQNATTFALAFGPMTDAYAPSVLRVLSRVQALGIPAFSLNLSFAGCCQCTHPSVSDHLTIAHSAQPIIAEHMGW